MLKQVQENLEALISNSYPGRGIVIGMDETGKNLVQIYWIMGRSKNSRNRVFEADIEIGKLWTKAANPSEVADPSLIIYTAMLEQNGLYAVSNGSHTDPIIEDRGNRTGPASFRRTMLQHNYEPDPPNFTPRISAICSLDYGVLPYAEMSIIRKSSRGKDPDHSFFRITEFQPGIGFCITTYDGPGDPLPAFSKVPYPLPIAGNILGVSHHFWNILNEENKISLGVKFINIETGKSEVGFINKYKEAL